MSLTSCMSLTPAENGEQILYSRMRTTFAWVMLDGGGACKAYARGFRGVSGRSASQLKMADPNSAAPAFKTKPAVTRKHLKRDQAAARKARGAANAGDLTKDRQVSPAGAEPSITGSSSL